MSLRKIIRQALTWLRVKSKPDFSAQMVPTHPAPEEIKPGRMLIVGGAGYQKWACFRCPGGCGETILLSLNQAQHPCWIVSTDWLEQPTVHPSIRQLNDCRCHFWIRQGAVEWCPDSGQK